MLEYIILGILYKDSMTGYDIKKCIDQGISMFYKASYGSLYPLLDKLLKRNLVTCSSEVEGKREKKKYTITECGQQAFLQWLTQEEYENSSIEAFMARVYFFDVLSENAATDIIRRYESRVKTYRDELQKKKEYYGTIENKEGYYFKLSTLYFGICKLQSMLDWCRTVENKENLNGLIRPERED